MLKRIGYLHWSAKSQLATDIYKMIECATIINNIRKYEHVLLYFVLKRSSIMIPQYLKKNVYQWDKQRRYQFKYVSWK